MVVHQYPPDAGITAYRMSYRARFLQQQGFEVDILAPGQVHETYIQSPGIRIHRITALGSSGSVDMDYTQHTSTAGLHLPQFLLPLAGFLRWLPPLIVHLRRIEAGTTILYTYNNPVSLHLAALAVRKRFQAWVCEFRDPIAGYEYSRRGILGRFSDGWLEKRVLRHADVLCMRRGIQTGPADYLTARGRVVLLPDYGVDLRLFSGFEAQHRHFEQPLGMYAGTVFSDMSFSALSSGLDQYCESHGAARIQLFGPEHREHKKYHNLHYGGNLGFEALLGEYRKADYLLVYDLSVRKESRAAEFFPSKLAEIIAVCRPVLFIGNLESQTARIIMELNLGVCVADDPRAIANAIHAILEGLKGRQFDLAMTDKKRQLINAEAAEQAFVDMLSNIPN